MIESSADASALLDNHDTFVFDCDGVLWVGNDPVPGAVECVQGLMHRGKSVFFVTNAAGKHRSKLIDKFHRLGFSDVRFDQIYSSAFATAMYLKRQTSDGSGGSTCHTVMSIGADGIVEELQVTEYLHHKR